MMTETYNTNLLQRNQNDRRMRFNNAKDPIYYAFEVIENRSLSALFADFVEDTIYDLTKSLQTMFK